MDQRLHFERNLLALATVNPRLCQRLSSAETTFERYRFLMTRNGIVVPAVVDRDGSARPLHSLIDPEKEAQRLVGTVRSGGFLILFGLGGGFVAEAALKREDIQGLLIIDFDINGIAELLASKEYVSLFGDSRCRILIDPSSEDLREAILNLYRPALSGGISVLPLRQRVEMNGPSFSEVSDVIKEIIDSISDDYSVQAYFGKRWFANIVRNIMASDGPVRLTPPIRSVAITAAGPSLDHQLSLLRKKRNDFFLLATDTSLPALLDADLKPNAVISIDCQHISYYHFMAGLPDDVPLYLDLASPPIVASRTQSPRFFSGGHPLTVYVSRSWRSFPRVDTSGGNVTYAAVALANQLGAEKIELYGADFSYPKGASYARGTYIHPYFQRMQNRLQPIEGLFSSFVYRNEALRKENGLNGWRYETKPLVGYRVRLEHLAENIDARIVPMEGGGAPILVPL
ncbi:MAG: 6-hydroxymethylpterin diphosphokinase MptE-like protein, partial [Treponemataceae bacterium]